MVVHTPHEPPTPHGPTTNAGSPPTSLPQFMFQLTPLGIFPTYVAPGMSVTVTNQIVQQLVVLHIVNALATRVVTLMTRHSVINFGALTTASVCLLVPANEYQRARKVLDEAGFVCDADGALIEVCASGAEPWLGVQWRRHDTALPPRIQVVDRAEMASIAARLCDESPEYACLAVVDGVKCANLTAHASRHCFLHQPPPSPMHAISHAPAPALK